jgi:hypothetical protein
MVILMGTGSAGSNPACDGVCSVRSQSYSAHSLLLPCVGQQGGKGSNRKIPGIPLVRPLLARSRGMNRAGVPRQKFMTKFAQQLAEKSVMPPNRT